MKIGSVALSAALLATPAIARGAGPLPASGRFIYSNACLSPGGDFAGYRVSLTRNAKGLSATVEFNDDGPDGSDKARDLTFEPVSGVLNFSFHGGIDADVYAFHGTVTKDKLVGTFGVKTAGRSDLGDGPLQTLPRAKTVPKDLPPCG